MGNIRIPQTLGPQQAATWFGLWRGVRLERDLTITLPVDASVLPAGIVLLASALAHRTAQGLTTKFALAGAPTTPEAGRPDAIGDLQRVDFFSSLGVPLEDKLQRHEAPDRLVVLRCIDSQAVARKMADDVRTFLERQLGGEPTSLTREAERVFEELGANIAQHSRRPRTGFGLAQALPAEGRLQIAFADSGVGFLESVRSTLDLEGRITDDAEAIQFALAIGRHQHAPVGRTNMKMGLRILQDFADRLQGELWIASGEALVHRRQVAGIASAQVRSIDRWEGTWLCLDAPLPG